MKNIPYPVFTGFYFLVAIMVLAADSFGLQWAFYLTKPALMLMIFVFFKMHSQETQHLVFRNLMLTAFAFCLVGDILLMFVENSEYFFIGGLVAFLVGHLLYTSAFISEIFRNRPWNQHWGQLAFSTLIVVYGAEFYILNRLSFGELQIPVLMYCIAITAMGVAAAMRDFFRFRKAFFMVLTGAVFFVISDSLLATNKFITQFDHAGILILGFYFTAQYMIAIGCLKSLKIKPDHSENPMKHDLPTS